MSDMMASAEQARQREVADRYRREHPGGSFGPRPTGWSIGVQFAGVMLTIIGSIHAVEGVVALFRDGFYTTTSDGLLIAFDFTVWGWVHIVLGIVTIAAGVSLQLGRMWARAVGVMVAAISLVANLAFVNARPIWAVLVILMDLLIIYAITVHGGELADQRQHVTGQSSSVRGSART